LDLDLTVLKHVVDIIEDKKGFQTVVLDLREISLITDYFLIVTGHSTTQVKAITEHIAEKLPALGMPILRVEGLPEAQWVLIDCGDLVFHVMTPDNREFYHLERLWGDAKIVMLEAV
jgi:ribosome-associated protein